MDPVEMRWSHQPEAQGAPSGTFYFGFFFLASNVRREFANVTTNIFLTAFYFIFQNSIGRQRHSSCLVGCKDLYIFGGFDGKKWLNDIHIMDVGRLEENALNGVAVRIFLFPTRFFKFLTSDGESSKHFFVLRRF